MKQRYVDQSNYEFEGGIVLDQEDMVERDGYRDTQQIVESMMAAGERLVAFRREEFDNEYEDLSEESLNDPTRRVGFDIIDAVAISRSEADRLTKLAAERARVEREKAEAEAKKNEPSK